MQAVLLLDKLMERTRNRVKLAEHFQNAFNDDPGGFFRTFIMPLLPRDTKIELGGTGVVEWRTLTGEVVKAPDEGPG